MTSKLINRLARLEATTAPLAQGKHLLFLVDAPRGTPTDDIVFFLKDRGHAIHEEDEVFVVNFGAFVLAEGDAPRDRSAELLTEKKRAALPAAGKWPSRSAPFTFNLDSPRGAR